MQYDGELYHYGVLGMRWGVRKKIASGFQRLSGAVKNFTGKLENRMNTNNASKWEKNSQRGAERARKEYEGTQEILNKRLRKLGEKNKDAIKADKKVQELKEEIAKAKYYMKHGGEKYLRDKYISNRTALYAMLGSMLGAPGMASTSGMAVGIVLANSKKSIKSLEEKAKTDAKTYKKKYKKYLK